MNRKQRRADFQRRFEAALTALGDEPGKDPTQMSRDELDAYLTAHGARRMTDEEVTARFGPPGTTTITFFGESHPPIERGDIVRVQEASGRWRNQMVAASSADGMINVTEEAEWQAANREDREPLTTAYPTAQVERRVEADLMLTKRRRRQRA